MSAQREVDLVQQQAEELQRQLVANNSSIASNQNALRRAKLTLKEMDTLPQDVRVYKAIGRM
jgi:chaperonin cofactor prefoldin